MAIFNPYQFPSTGSGGEETPSLLPPRGRELHSSWKTPEPPKCCLPQQDGVGKMEQEHHRFLCSSFIRLVTEGFIFSDEPWRGGNRRDVSGGCGSCHAGRFSAGGGSVHVCWKSGPSFPTCLMIAFPRQCSTFVCNDYSIIFKTKRSLNYGGWFQSPCRNTRGFTDPSEGRGSAAAALSVLR